MPKKPILPVYTVILCSSLSCHDVKQPFGSQGNKLLHQITLSMTLQIQKIQKRKTGHPLKRKTGHPLQRKTGHPLQRKTRHPLQR